MHAMVYLMLMAAPCLARYHFEPRDLLKRDEPRQRGEWVECPVCEPAGYSQLNGEGCTMRDGRSAKLCLYGTYINEFCGSRRDCYRGPDEKCTDNLENDEFGKQCAPGYTCSSITGKCMGLGRPYRIGELHDIDAFVRYPLTARRARDIDIGHM